MKSSPPTAAWRNERRRGSLTTPSIARSASSPPASTAAASASSLGTVHTGSPAAASSSAASARASRNPANGSRPPERAQARESHRARGRQGTRPEKPPSARLARAIRLTASGLQACTASAYADAMDRGLLPERYPVSESSHSMAPGEPVARSSVVRTRRHLKTSSFGTQKQSGFDPSIAPVAQRPPKIVWCHASFPSHQGATPARTALDTPFSATRAAASATDTG
mmetsp:Transcript_17294/g.41319  ORF Transcript_17294/g.41319 Transcript_17294/m.41319 type:complete len:225 (-) Transcript_17294:2028-2702(-)